MISNSEIERFEARARQEVVLDYLNRAGRAVLSSQISRDTGLPRPEVAAACRSLHQNGLIKRYLRYPGSACKWEAVW